MTQIETADDTAGSARSAAIAAASSTLRDAIATRHATIAAADAALADARRTFDRACHAIDQAKDRDITTDAIDDRILEQLEAGPHSTAQLAAIIGLPIGDIRARVRRLTEAGMIGDHAPSLRRWAA